MTSKNEVAVKKESTVLTIAEATALKGNKAIAFWCNKENVESLTKQVRDQALSIVPDLTTKKGRDAIGSNAMDVSKSRKLLEESIKSAISGAQKVVDEGKAIKKFVIEECNEVRDEVLQPRKEWQEEQDRIEAERVKGIRDRINNIALIANVTSSESKEQLADVIDALNAMDVSQGFDEFTQEAMQAKSDAIQKINDAVAEIVRREIEEETQRELEEKEAELEEERKKTRIGERIQKLQGIPMEMFSSTADEVQAKIDALDKHAPTVEDFGDRHSEAISVFDGVVANLNMLLEQKKQLEEMQAKQKAECVIKDEPVLHPLESDAEEDPHNPDCKGCPDCGPVMGDATYAIMEDDLKEMVQSSQAASLLSDATLTKAAKSAHQLPESEEHLYNDCIADAKSYCKSDFEVVDRSDVPADSEDLATKICEYAEGAIDINQANHIIEMVRNY